MRSILVALVTGLLAAGSYSTQATAQYMFLDTDDDGVHTDADFLSSQTTSVDIWLQTNLDGSGAQTTIRDGAGQLPSINSYQFILRAFDGEVEWGDYINLQPTMTVAFGPRQNKTDFYHGFGGLPSLPPGKYKLGRLGLRVLSGDPRLEFADRTPLWGVARTAFGSKAPGVDKDHTLKLGGVPASDGGTPQTGDWTDASGAAVSPASTAGRVSSAGGIPLRFSVRVSANPWKGPGQIELETSRAGRIRIRIFDLNGRLVRTVADEPSLSAGRHLYSIDTRATEPARMAAGVYFYRVEASEGVRHGRIVVISR